MSVLLSKGFVDYVDTYARMIARYGSIDAYASLYIQQPGLHPRECDDEHIRFWLNFYRPWIMEVLGIKEGFVGNNITYYERYFIAAITI